MPDDPLDDRKLYDESVKWCDVCGKPAKGLEYNRCQDCLFKPIAFPANKEGRSRLKK